jgi:hypothetical protein
VQLVYSTFYSFADGQRKGRVTFSPVEGLFFFYVTVIRSAPAASDFSKICGSIVYETPPAKVSAVDLFDISPKVLMGLGDQDQRAAVRRLVDVLSDESMVAGLTVLSEEPTERLQFLSVADLLLRRITLILEVNKKIYSETTLRMRQVHRSIAPKFLGMGTQLTWHGTPDGRADWTSLSVVCTTAMTETGGGGGKNNI